MAKKTNGTVLSKSSEKPATFGSLKVGEKFTLEGKREGSPGRKPIFTKAGPRAYTTRLGEKVSTRALSTAVRKVAR